MLGWAGPGWVVGQAAPSHLVRVVVPREHDVHAVVVQKVLQRRLQLDRGRLLAGGVVKVVCSRGGRGVWTGGGPQRASASVCVFIPQLREIAVGL